MVSLFFILFLSVLIFCIVRFVKVSEKSDGDEELYFIMSVFFGTLTVIFLIWTSVLIYTVGTAETIDRKITMYEEENAAIEESIDVTVKSYMDFEASTYIELKDKDAINLVSLFPKLKSDTLVKKQINVYIKNQEKIQKLKEAKIDLSKEKWLLYFGK